MRLQTHKLLRMRKLLLKLLRKPQQTLRLRLMHRRHRMLRLLLLL